MKDFIKWLGVNEKIAKLVVWIFIILTMLIIINAALGSLGFPNYQITYDNLKQIKMNKVVDIAINALFAILNFYAIVLLIFRVKEAKSIFKYSLVYLFFNGIIATFFNEGILQVFIFLFIILFSYFYANKNKKYILYAILSIVINILMEGIAYLYKVKFIDYTSINSATRLLLFSDYFIIMIIIILVKEIYLNKRSERGK